MSDPENTGSKQVATQFKPGQSGNPKGRPLGARNKLGKDFIEALEADFGEHGKSVIASVRTERPHEYLKVVAGLLPKELHVKDESLDDLTREEAVDVLAAVRGLIAERRAAPSAGDGGARGGGDSNGVGEQSSSRH